jgi:solute carrier family 25 (mitochondrial phosphate transporter), member 23/24/25/41
LELPVIVRLACGGVAGAVAQTVTYPLDVIRRRMQVAFIDTSHRANIGWLELARHLYATEGVIAFYRGIFPNLLKVVPAISTSFVVYEYAKSFLDKLFP